jgi:hypothetical protein
VIPILAFNGPDGCYFEALWDLNDNVIRIAISNKKSVTSILDFPISIKHHHEWCLIGIGMSPSSVVLKVCTYIYIYVYISICIYTFVYIYIYFYIYIYIVMNPSSAVSKVNSISSALLYCFLLVIYLSAILISFFCTYAVLAGPYGYRFL